MHFKLAQALVPDAQLAMYSSNGGCYSVVFDTKHQIVFDSFWYFVGTGASEALAASRKAPNYSNLDYDWPHLRWRELHELQCFVLFRAELPSVFVEMLRRQVYTDAMPWGNDDLYDDSREFYDEEYAYSNWVERGQGRRGPDQDDDDERERDRQHSLLTH